VKFITVEDSVDAGRLRELCVHHVIQIACHKAAVSWTVIWPSRVSWRHRLPVVTWSTHLFSAPWVSRQA